MVIPQNSEVFPSRWLSRRAAASYVQDRTSVQADCTKKNDDNDGCYDLCFRSSSVSIWLTPFRSITSTTTDVDCILQANWAGGRLNLPEQKRSAGWIWGVYFTPLDIQVRLSLLGRHRSECTRRPFSHTSDNGMHTCPGYSVSALADSFKGSQLTLQSDTETKLG